jgi:hypothetical protein
MKRAILTLAVVTLAGSVQAFECHFPGAPNADIVQVGETYKLKSTGQVLKWEGSIGSGAGHAYSAKSGDMELGYGIGSNPIVRVNKRDRFPGSCQ